MSYLGRRDRLITLLAPQAAGQDAFGAPAPTVYTEAALAEEWAEVKYPRPGTEAFLAAQHTATQPATFIIRYRSDVKPTWRLTHEGRTYHITAVQEIGRRQATSITAEVRNDGTE